jgi:transposase
MLVNPQHVKALAGRKTDRIDAQRLGRYLENEEMDGSFIPPRGIRELRDLMRSRVQLVEEVNRVKNRIGQLCEAGNIKVSSVATDLFGVSGRKMLEAIAEGKRDAGWMADYARGKLRHKKAELELALEGTFTGHQRWMLLLELKHLSQLEVQIGSEEAEIARRMVIYEEPIRRLTTIPGVDLITAWTLLAELGPDMTVFPTARHAASWAGLCPGNRESGGKQLSGRTRKGNPYIRRILCQAAWAASHTKDTYLSALFRRMRNRMGHNKAILAVAHQILLTAYTMLLREEDYKELGGTYFEQKNKPKVVNRLVEKLTKLGYAVTLQQAPGSEEPGGSMASSPASVSEVITGQPAAPTAKRNRGRPCKCRERGIPCTHGKPRPLQKQIQNNSKNSEAAGDVSP